MPEHELQQMQHVARRLLQEPLMCAEQQPDMFATIRRHEQTLDRWFTQRLGYRLHVSSTTARLYKSTVLPHRRSLVTATSSRRPLTRTEYTYLVLTLAAVAAGPRVISLHDLINDVRSAATDADIQLGNELADRRAMVTALKWMVKAGLATELHEHVGRYEQDENADAILEVEPDRIGLLPLTALGRAETAEQLLDRSVSRANPRQWLRARLVEDPVLYREDLSEDEWSTLRRRQSEEASLLNEMFGLELESRAEGVAAIDPHGQLSDQTFPATGTVSHAALLMLDELVNTGGGVTTEEALPLLESLCQQHRKHWSKTQTENMTSLLQRVLSQLVDMRLVKVVENQIQTLPAAVRFTVVDVTEEDSEQQSRNRDKPTARTDRRSPEKSSGRNEARAENPDDAQRSLW